MHKYQSTLNLLLTPKLEIIGEKFKAQHLSLQFSANNQTFILVVYFMILTHTSALLNTS